MKDLKIKVRDIFVEDDFDPKDEFFIRVFYVTEDGENFSVTKNIRIRSRNQSIKISTIGRKITDLSIEFLDSRSNKVNFEAKEVIVGNQRFFNYVSVLE